MALEGAYAFDDVGSTTVVDLSGNGRHIDLDGTNGAQVDSVGLLDDGALGKTGVDTISLPASLRVASETDDRTVMFDGLGGRSVWWIRWESTALDTGVWGLLSLDAASVVARARTQANGTSTPAAPTIGALESNTRHNFCVTYTRSSGVVAYYYDGQPIGTATFAAGTALYTGADDLNVAEWNSTGASLDNLRIYSHALTAGEVADVAGTPVSGGSEITGTGAAQLGALTATATGVRGVVGTAVTALGALTATITATVTVTGVAGAALGALRATAFVPGNGTTLRLRASGREPRSHVAGREPRRSI